MGDVFTWRNKQFRDDDYIRERLDRAVANGGWREVYPLVQVRNGDPFHSDHRPVIISLEGGAGQGRANGGPRTFKFEASWLKEEQCADVVMEAWEAGSAWGEGRVVDKLKSVAHSLHSWNVNVLGDLEKRIKKLKKDLERCRRLPIDAFSVQRRRC